MADLSVAPERSHAHQFLLRCLRPEDGLGQRIGGLPEPAWGPLVDEAIRQGVGPLLHRYLEGSDDVRVPEASAQRLRDVYLHSHLKNTALLEQFNEVVSIVAVSGAALIPLKGAHLAIHVYEDPGLRPMSDLDLLIREDDLQAVRQALLDTGYEETTSDIEYLEHHHLGPLSKRGRVEVELHRGIAPLDAPFKVDIAGLWTRADGAPAGTTARQMAPDDLLLHLCTHTAFNDELRVGLLAYCDIDATVRRYSGEMDWERFAETANLDGRSRFVYVALQITARLLQTPFPSHVWRALEHASTDENIVAHAATYVFDSAHDVPVTFQRLGEADGPASKLGSLAVGLFPPVDDLRRIYGVESENNLAYLLYVWRPLDLLIRHGWNVAGLVLGRPRARPAQEKERRRRLIRTWLGGPD